MPGAISRTEERFLALMGEPGAPALADFLTSLIALENCFRGWAPVVAALPMTPELDQLASDLGRLEDAAMAVVQEVRTGRNLWLMPGQVDLDAQPELPVTGGIRPVAGPSFLTPSPPPASQGEVPPAGDPVVIQTTVYREPGKINMGRTLGKAAVFLLWAVMRP